MRILAPALVAGLLLAGCSSPAAPSPEAPVPSAPEPFLVSIPVDVEVALQPEGGCLVQDDPAPVVSPCDASHEYMAVDLLPNQTLVQAHLVLTPGGVVPQGSEPVLRMTCLVDGTSCDAPLAEASGAGPVTLDWSGSVDGPELRVELEAFLRGPTAVAAWYPVVASASVQGQLVVLQAPTANLPAALVLVAEAIDVAGQTAPCVRDSGLCDYPDGDNPRFGPYEQPIQEVHLVVSWDANDPSNERLTLRITCNDGREYCDSYEPRVLEGTSPLAFDEAVRFPPTGQLEVALIRYTEVPGVVGPIAQPYRVAGTVHHLADPDARHQA